MTCTSADAPRLVLYHAVSSYQLLEAMLHRRLYHAHDRAVLLLPDFITQKYPQYRKLRSGGFFEEVYLFPYLRIRHGEEQGVLEDVAWWYGRLVPHAITAFSDIYVAGAHFYFSLYLLDRRVPFVFWEDAAGMLSRADELYETLSRRFPQHAQIARRHGLFDGQNPCIRRILCLKRAQTIDVSGERYEDFSVERALEALPARARRRLVRFFLRRRLRGGEDAILLTQHFAGLGRMTEAEQRRLYERLRDGPLRGIRLLIKAHPDDTLCYTGIFPDAAVIRETFPAELLPYVFRHRPPVIYTVNSTGCENLREHFLIRQIGRDFYAH